MRSFLLYFFVLLFLSDFSLCAQNKPILKVGVLSFRSTDATTQQWLPTVKYLEDIIPSHKFEFIPFYYDNFEKIISHDGLDFILTNPEHFVLNRTKFGFSSIATLMPNANGRATADFGGVIFTRADSTTINNLQDIQNKKIASPSQESFAGYLAQMWTLNQNGINTTLNISFTGMPHDKAVYDVISKKAEVGFVRTGVLEAMIAEKKIEPSSIKIINAQNRNDFELMLSTELYPEWPFAVRNSVSPEITKKVVKALLNIESNTSIAIIGKYFGFAPPKDYMSVETIMQKLHVHPDYISGFDFKYFISKYAYYLFTFAFAGFVISMIIIAKIMRDKKNLDNTSKTLEKSYAVIKEAEESYRGLFNALRHAVYILNFEGKFIDVSQGAEEMYGYSKNEFIGKTPEFLSAENKNDMQKVFDYFTLAIAGQPQLFEFWGKRSNGKIFPKDVSLSRGKYFGKDVLIAVGIDITDRQNMLKTIETQKIRLESLVDSMPDLVWMKDENGVYLTCNKRFEDFFGAKHDEIVGKTDYDYVSQELADFFRAHDTNAMNSSAPVVNFEEITFASDGHKESLQTIKTAVKDKNGNLLGVLGIGRDITDMKKNQEQLQVQKDELQTIFDISKDGIAILDLQSNFLEFNDAYLELTGYTREELLQKSCIGMTAPEERETSKEALQKVIELGYIKNYEKTCITKQGAKIIISMSVMLMPDKKRVFVSAKDITKNKLFEEQSKLASMGEMIGNIAHQWRQPLSVISTIASGIKIGDEFGTLSNFNILEDMDSIIFQTQYLSKTIDDFRNFIKDTHEKSTISLRNTIHKTLSIVNSALINNNIQLVLNLQDDAYIIGFENELMQAFINIINNARDAMRDNVENDDDKYIFISTQKIDKGLQITIKDSGGGIYLDIMSKIFEPYFTTKHQSVGTGIGLSMARQIITEHHEATIDVTNTEYEYNSKVYRGAEFTINFILN